MATPPFEHLDFLYMPSRDVAADRTYFTTVLGGREVFAIDGMGARVAAIELTAGPPLVLLADHVEGEAPVLVFRVVDLPRGWPRWSLMDGSARGRSRSRTGRVARFGPRAGTAWRSISSPART